MSLKSKLLTSHMKGFILGILITALISWQIMQAKTEDGDLVSTKSVESDNMKAYPSLKGMGFEKPPVTKLDIGGTSYSAPIITLHKLDPVFSLEADMVENVCLALARRDRHGLERWRARITLKDKTLLPTAYSKATNDAGANATYGLVTLTLSSHDQYEYVLTIPEGSDDIGAPEQSADIELHFGEKDMYFASNLLIILSPDHKVMPCEQPTEYFDIEQYNSWKAQWQDRGISSESMPLPDGYSRP